MARGMSRLTWRRATAAIALAVGSGFLSPDAAIAAEGNIDHVEPVSQGVQILFSVPADADLSDEVTSQASIGDIPVESTVTLAADSEEIVTRTAVLAVDTSQSMRGRPFEAAKAAARQFAESAPSDLRIGLVSFDREVETVLEPTPDRATLSEALESLTLSYQTHLYDGVIQAVNEAGEEGQRSVLVLSDGADTSKTDLSQVTATVQDSGVKVDVVALAQSEEELQKLETIATAGSGETLEADDPEALGSLFAREADALARQLLVAAELPANFDGVESSVTVEVTAGSQTFVDSAFAKVRLASAPQANPEKPTTPAKTFLISEPIMLVGLGAAGIALGIVVLVALGGLQTAKPTIEQQMAGYGRHGLRPSTRPIHAATHGDGVTAGAKSLAEQVLSANKGFDAALSAKLEAAGMSLKPAEWLLIQVGSAFGAALVGALLGSFPMAVLLLGLGLAIPYVYLTLKKARRVRAFGDQLADTLQLMAGSLSAGLSFAQSIDTVVREGSEPVTTEFKRALIEARLGVQLEDALENVADRMQSADFKWVVLAVRIQREVGGNLAEVLNQVADTIRERAYLKRQVKSLSAEGVLSAWILGALPPAMFVYFLMVNPDYMQPMFTEPMGWAMLGGGVLMMAIGAFWMNRLVKIEV